MGYTLFAPTPEQRKLVKSAAGVGLSHKMICDLIEQPLTGEPIDTKTLRKHFRAELDAGSAKATYNVGSNLYRMACGTGREAATCAIFWMKTRAKWREGLDLPDAEEHEADEGGQDGQAKVIRNRFAGFGSKPAA